MIDYETFKEKIIFYFKQYDIEINEKIIKDFYVFTDFLRAENKKYNLTSIRPVEDIILKHYIDSVIILKYFDIPENSKIIDVGTGAGFPGLPLLIMRRDLQMTFLDSSHKKINFIKNSLELLELQAELITGRAEDFSKNSEIREAYDFAVSRAVARLNILCELTIPFIKPGGFFIAYKSQNTGEEISESENIFRALDLAVTGTEEFDLNENKRVLLKIKKSGRTPLKYPRKYSDILKKPL